MKNLRLATLVLLCLALACAVPAAATPAPATPTATQSADFAAALAGCPMFMANNIWNARVDSLPPDSNSAAYIQSIGTDTRLHPDFGTEYEGAPIGIPFDVVPGSQPLVEMSFGYDDQSDPGPYPIPPNATIEGGPDSDGDRHVLVLERDSCTLYEMWDSWPQQDGSWYAGSGAVFNLYSNDLRPDGWTSADAAGLPILPGLVRYDEVMAGAIQHAIRFTADETREAHIWPARHDASDITDPDVPPMGQRFRLKASFDVSGYPPEIQVIFNAMKTYGIILADNGSNWYVSGVHDDRWNDEMLVEAFRTVHGSDFEAVDVSSLMVDPESGAVLWPAGGFFVWMPISNR